MEHLVKANAGKNALILGISHMHPHFLKQLQVVLDENSLSTSNQIDSTTKNDTEFLLCSDADFHLF